jgi:hypothetical protein
VGFHLNVSAEIGKVWFSLINIEKGENSRLGVIESVKER